MMSWCKTIRICKGPSQTRCATLRRRLVRLRQLVLPLHCRRQIMRRSHGTGRRRWSDSASLRRHLRRRMWRRPRWALCARNIAPGPCRISTAAWTSRPWSAPRGPPRCRARRRPRRRPLGLAAVWAAAAAAAAAQRRGLGSERRNSERSNSVALVVAAAAAELGAAIAAKSAQHRLVGAHAAVVPTCLHSLPTTPAATAATREVVAARRQSRVTPRGTRARSPCGTHAVV
jgi:hypothetical protein